jgi:uncharacterized protein YdeI (YjbR/CyaY-like superfamily)
VLSKVKGIRRVLSRNFRKRSQREARIRVDPLARRNTARRDVELPQTLADALAADSAARAGFDQLAYTHRKEYARWISEAKRDETRKRRIAEALELLRKGKPRR